MNNKLTTTTVYYGSTISILFGFTILLGTFALVLLGAYDWDELVEDCLPPVILIVGGLLAMAISSLSTSDQGVYK